MFRKIAGMRAKDRVQGKCWGCGGPRLRRALLLGGREYPVESGGE